MASVSDIIGENACSERDYLNPRVLFIAGEGRSGSTLLDRLLGDVASGFSCGEMWVAWERSFGKNQLCGCGATFADCEFWNTVRAEIIGRCPGFSAERVLWIQKQIMRLRYIPFLIFPKLQTKRYGELLAEYGRQVRTVYDAIAHCAKAPVLVDSSKMPLYGMVLYAIGLDLRVIHLTRNSNAVAYSWSRARVRPEITERTEMMPRYSAVTSALSWVKINLLSQLLCMMAGRYIHVRYEDLCANIGVVMKRIQKELEIDVPEEKEVDGAYHFRKNHTLSGNPMRFAAGTIQIKHDDEWQNKMSPASRFIVSAITWPLLLAYGYGKRPRAA